MNLSFIIFNPPFARLKIINKNSPLIFVESLSGRFDPSETRSAAFSRSILPSRIGLPSRIMQMSPLSLITGVGLTFEKDTESLKFSASTEKLISLLSFSFFLLSVTDKRKDGIENTGLNSDESIWRLLDVKEF